MEAWRSGIIAAASSWLGTRWHHNQCVKGAGVDCGRFIHAAYLGAGLVAAADFGRYEADWMMHRTEERYLAWVEKYLDRVDAPLPGDVAVWRYGHCFSHGAIVVDWPIVLHSFRRERAVVWGDGSKGELATEVLKGGGEQPREVRFYSIAGRL
jgi:cell wall-associated NlpC family hydrolase